MDRIVVEGVRCFHRRQSAPLRPLTLLVGENSSGKTTFLALVRIACDLSRGDPSVDFNEEPFLLGAYDQVASYRGGRAGRAKRFSIGAHVSVNSDGPEEGAESLAQEFTVTGWFAHTDELTLSEWLLEVAPYRVTIRYDEAQERPLMTIEAPSGSASVEPAGWLPVVPGFDELFSYLFFATTPRFREEGWATLEGDVSEADLEALNALALRLPRSVGPRPYAFAPIRTRPLRTYEPLKDIRRPEGSHVPVILAKTSLSDPKGWGRLRQSLDSFGAASGLFTDVRVRRLGRKASDPFQLRVKISGPDFNLVDVGYGVSQALPIVVDALREPQGSTFLLQQPEVHLHPKAQSELASFLAVLATEQNKRFVIETHSDYIVDRIRADIRDHEYLSPEDVALLYFQREDGGVSIHTLEIDDSGNILKPPRAYRQFFLEEERRLLGG